MLKTPRASHPQRFSSQCPRYDLGGTVVEELILCLSYKQRSILGHTLHLSRNAAPVK
jgi:hypothetical protein